MKEWAWVAAAVVLVRHFRAQAEDVFDAWIDPAKIRHWFGPGLGELRQIDIDPRVGGRFTHRTVRFDGGIIIGMTSRDPSFGFTAGLTWVFRAFTVP